MKRSVFAVVTGNILIGEYGEDEADDDAEAVDKAIGGGYTLDTAKIVGLEVTDFLVVGEEEKK